MFKQPIRSAAPAKINLALDVLGKRSDGYHEMRMINHSCTLYDYLSISPSTEYVLEGDTTVAQEDNLITRAVNLLDEETGCGKDVKITVEKNIPERAGLAGGSADAAATLKLMIRHKNLSLSPDKLKKIALQLGADVPFCLYNTLSLVEGVGERIKKLPSNLKAELLIVAPSFPVSTPQAFDLVDQLKNPKHTKIDQLIPALERGDFDKIRQLANNTFTQAIALQYPQIEEIIANLYNHGASYATMSGSGSSVVGYFDKTALRDKARKFFPNHRTYPAQILL